MASTTTRYEWRVETDQTEDDFGVDQAAARDWLARCADHPDWRPAVLQCREVTVTTSPWYAVDPTHERVS